MTDSIREQICTAFKTRLQKILTSNQYNSDMGSNVMRSHLPPVDGSLAPAIGFHLDDEENLQAYEQSEQKELPIRVQGVSKKISPNTYAETTELLYADICECVLCEEWSVGYDSGGTTEIEAGDTIIDETTGATGLVESLTLDSGSWAGGDAAGTFTLRRVTGFFRNNSDLQVGVDTGLATVDGTPSGTGALELTTNNLCEAITFSTGNIKTPESDGNAVGVQIVIRVIYRSIAGNPYSQTI